jgi:hypothetical protein
LAIQPLCCVFNPVQATVIFWQSLHRVCHQCAANEVELQFFLGILLFIGVIGALDAPLPWPHSQKRNKKL